MKRVFITPGCISCGTCENICPEVFELKQLATVKKDLGQNVLNKNEELIKEAAEICPVSAIKFEE